MSIADLIVEITSIIINASFIIKMQSGNWCFGSTLNCVLFNASLIYYATEFYGVCDGELVTQDLIFILSELNKLENYDLISILNKLNEFKSLSISELHELRENSENYNRLMHDELIAKYNNCIDDGRSKNQQFYEPEQ